MELSFRPENPGQGPDGGGHITLERPMKNAAEAALMVRAVCAANLFDLGFAAQGFLELGHFLLLQLLHDLGLHILKFWQLRFAGVV